MSRQKGSANFAGTIEVLAGGPLDARTVVGTVADLTTAATFDYTYEGMKVYVKATKKCYTLTGDDPTVSANWVVDGSDIEVDDEISASSENPVQNKVIKDALDGKADLTGGKVPASQLPSYVDDVVEGYYNETDGKFYEESTYETEITGEAGKIYLSLDTDKSYRWSGSEFVKTGDGAGHTIKNNAGTTVTQRDIMQFGGDIETTDDNTNQQTVVEPHELTNAEILEIMSSLPSGTPTKLGVTPVGTVIAVMGNSAPANYLACQGQVVNIADYPELADYFEDQFGSKNNFGGDGTTTFGIPDLRGEFLRGTGTNSHTGCGNGANVGVHQDPTYFPRIINESSTNSSYLVITRGVGLGTNNSITIDNSEPSKGIHSTTGKFSTTAGTISTMSDAGDGQISSRPTNTSVLYCIATKDIYVDARFDYSTQEKVVGTWIDGKTLYQKTFTGVGPSAIDTNTSIGNIGFAVDTCVFITKEAYNSGTTIQSIPDTYIRLWINKSNGNIFIRVSNEDYINWNFVVTIQYTKTTD